MALNPQPAHGEPDPAFKGKLTGVKPNTARRVARTGPGIISKRHQGSGTPMNHKRTRK